MAKRVNRQDLTTINLHKTRRVEATLDQQVKRLYQRVAKLTTRNAALEERVADLENNATRPFVEQQRALGYRHSTSAPGSLIVRR